MKNLSFFSKIILLVTFALFINACDKDEAVLTYDITGDWKVISFEDYETSTVITKTEDNTWSQFNNGDITVNFTENDLTSGIICGIKVTNSFSGNYKIGPNGVITISNFIQTLINEPEWGRLFDSFVEAETYKFRNGRLIIFYNQRKNSITLERTDE